MQHVVTVTIGVFAANALFAFAGMALSYSQATRVIGLNLVMALVIGNLLLFGPVLLCHGFMETDLFLGILLISSGFLCVFNLGPEFR